MAYNKVPVANRFVHAKFDDYGTRKAPAMALVYHMAEGNNVWRYLSTGNVARGVSVHFTIEADGEIVQMMNLSRISGSINPKTLRTDNDAYYGYKHAKGVLKSWWSNPNNAVISVEIAGKAVDGPNAKQVAAGVVLFDYLRGRYPDIVPLGHRDFQNVKRCPGNTANMKSIFTKDGGHGLYYKKPKPAPTPTPPTPTPTPVPETTPLSTINYRPFEVGDITNGTALYDAPNGKKIGTADSDLTSRATFGTSADGKWRLVASVLDGKSRTAWVDSTKVKNVRVVDQVVTLTATLAAVKKAVTSAAVAADNTSDLMGKVESLLK